MRYKVSNKKKKLKIIPLGGLGEVGKNITAFEYGNDIVVVDCGIAFPEDEMLGIDLVMPDITYLKKNKEQKTALCSIDKAVFRSKKMNFRRGWAWI